MKRTHLFLYLLLAIIPEFAFSQSLYKNPILGGDYPDPTILRDGDDYYMTHSAFDYQPGLTVFHSKDLVNWTPVSYALKEYLGSVWAPDISKYKDKYYIYFTVAFPDRRKNFVTYASSPEGPWSDPIDLKIGNIDPCHVVGEDGSRWLFMSAGKRVRLTDDGLAIVSGTEEVVYKGWEYPEDWVTEGFCLEGPKIKKLGEYYYYLNAEGGTAGPPTSHMITVARSKSLNGPWENSPYNPLVHTYNKADRWWSKGHGSIIDTPSGKLMVVYHSYENGFYNLGRQTLMEPVYLTEDGWLKRYEDVDIEKPIKAPLAIADNKSDRLANLDKFRLGYEWKFYKSFDASRISVDKNRLSLKAKGVDVASSAPIMFVAGLHAYEVEAEIELYGDVTAGIVLYYNSDFFMGTGFNKNVRTRYRKGDERRGGRHENATKMWLRIRNDNHIVTGSFSYDGKKWERETWGMNISGYNHNTLYEFQSVLPGLFVYGNGKAEFSNFKFTPLDL